MISRRTLLIALAPAMALVACGQQERGPVDSEVSPTSGADDEQTLPGERSLADETRTGPTRARQDASDISANRIPARFRGIWDYAQGDCDPDSDLRMEIGAKDIEFYEALGEVSKVEADGDAVLVTLEMEGEGESWEQTTRFVIVEKGASQRLITSETQDPATADGYVSRKCPA